MSGIALDDFVAEAKSFLDANAEPRSEQKFVWGEGPDRVGILDEKTPDAYGVDVKPRLEVLKTAEPSGRKAGVKVASVAELVGKLKNEAGVL